MPKTHRSKSVGNRIVNRLKNFCGIGGTWRRCPKKVDMLHQLYCFRPVAGWADHRTPVPGLYLCGAASHPGGGVMGACGRNAAREIVRDKPW